MIAGLLSLPAAALATVLAERMRETKPISPGRELLVRKIRNAALTLAASGALSAAVLGWQAIEERNTAMAQAAREHFDVLLYRGG